MSNKIHNFNEKEYEYCASKCGEIPVWQSPKYTAAKEKAIEMIDSGKYGLSDADFWILMNATKTGKMMYSGLIISHNGCLKINDNMAEEKKFKPECVSLDKEGYGGSLACFYICPEQGLFEVGEVTSRNCKNEYPYAMAVKRLFDRVVLKNSKLAYSGVYSDSESDEFKEPQETPKDNTQNTPKQSRPQNGTNVDYRLMLMNELKRRGINLQQYAVEKKINGTTTAERYAELLRELED